MRGPAELAARAAVRYQRVYAAWAANPDQARAEVLPLSLDPPTHDLALADVDGVAAWIAAWRQWERSAPGTVIWEGRRWASLGTQHLPVRAQLVGADAIASAAGRAGHWGLASSRAGMIAGMLEALGVGPTGLSGQGGAAEAVAAVIGEVVEYEDDDVERLVAAVAWLASHPASGLYLRQLPIAGLDTKWLERHRRVVQRLLGAARGGGLPVESGLGLRRPPTTVRVRILDPGLAAGGLRDVEAPVEEISRMWADRAGFIDVIAVENLATFLALEERPRTVAVWGAGDKIVQTLPLLSWARRARRVVYWGDLDADGMRILACLSQRLPGIVPVLMDAPTLERWRCLAVADPGKRVSRDGPQPEGLGYEQMRAWRMIIDWGLSLEQERLPWDEATSALSLALA
ncbi:DUF3322 domain-containing protein [Actinomyces sp. zg296]|uniref:DUF3322 domain-containing protein n=1 Tax=Actinomyces sp. zg296 TaxID=2609289 RepID=UPI001358E37A|nr:DUF3322 domain-containing protein [Actinomyces sp. zg296]